MNIGEKIANYKDKLEFPHYAGFAKACGVTDSFLLGISKKQGIEELTAINIENLKKVTDFLGITIDELLRTDTSVFEIHKTEEIKYLNDCNDVGTIITELQTIIKKKDTKIDGIPMNLNSKQVFVDILDILRIMTKQKL